MLVLYLAVLSGFVYGLRSINGPFLFDDPTIEDAEPGMKSQSGRPFFRGFWKEFTQFWYYSRPWNGHRPLTSVIHLFIYERFGMNVKAYRVANLVFHVGCIWAFHVVASVWLSGSRANLATIIYAVHPINTASVCYVSGRSGIQAMFFLLCAWALFQLGYWPLGLISGGFACKSKPEFLLLVPLYPIFSFCFG